ncbi:MAG: TetR/AcrR family transcriptional regulator [Actinomycetota bacterium]|nr:TetR/AcrR family transcriptional regulator [Actinomycetota bacterium]
MNLKRRNAGQLDASCCPPGEGRRRRGSQLERAIFDAVVAELGDAGYEGLTMEGVAHRAQTGKAALYRRWPSKQALVVDALDATMPCFDETPGTGSVRTDLIELLGRMAVNISSPTGCAMQSVLGNSQCSPSMLGLIRDRVLEPRRRMLIDAVRQGMERGEVRADVAAELAAEVGPSMIVQRYLTEGPPVTHKMAVEIVDEVIMPMLAPRGDHDG